MVMLMMLMAGVAAYDEALRLWMTVLVPVMLMVLMR